MSTETAGAARTEPARLRAVELPALAGVWRHEVTLFTYYWRSTSFSAVVEPTIYLLSFGTGFGSLVGRIAGYRYIEFLGTGVVATTALFVSAFAGMFQTFVRRVYQHAYDALLAAPVDTHEVVLGEALFIAVKAGVYCLAPLAVAMCFGLDPAPGMVLVPLIGFLTGLGFALAGILASALVPSIDSFNYIISGVITPLFLVAGTFFPVSQLPGWAQGLATLNPLYHCVELVRHAVFGLHPLADLGHVAVLALFALLAGWLAVWRMRAKLVD
ncbi:lipooligosaccharide transport system permease protein [Motilibacter rhizosphaerae]|uniref:Transport permease protein n=1 Tax=Motilibacter rhizosphaerae TaxID=598652 RepID=A0A4Q7NRV8_9ACTN|nr:ABC transporter permease [Motilibacter rhizosphaerae]RZS89826.1 lipooligosaccharide transport system permease protein [Motilibacter rhizosphaerae]